jgi:hypothetical protein
MFRLSARLVASANEQRGLAGALTADDEVDLAANCALELVGLEVIPLQGRHLILGTRITYTDGLKQCRGSGRHRIRLCEVSDDQRDEVGNRGHNVGFGSANLNVVPDIERNHVAVR